MTTSLIISHFNENLDWINNVDESINIYLYTKSGNYLETVKKNNVKIIQLNNIGNEQHTYFYHVTKNYENLDDILFFTQANPYEHSKFFNEKLNSRYIGGLSDFNLITSVFGPINDNNNYQKHINHKYDNLSYEQVINNIFIDTWNDNKANHNINYIIDNLTELNIKKTNWVFNANGMYSTTNVKILSINKLVYEKCLSFFSDTNINMAAFAFERLNQFILLK